jgi:fibronectin-binding autotransporter adhesin
VLFLTATNTYSGGTTISGGALIIGSGGASGSIVGDVLNNGTLALNRNDTVTFGGVISGTRVLEAWHTRSDWRQFVQWRDDGG